MDFKYLIFITGKHQMLAWHLKLCWLKILNMVLWSKQRFPYHPKSNEDVNDFEDSA